MAALDAAFEGRSSLSVLGRVITRQTMLRGRELIGRGAAAAWTPGPLLGSRRAASSTSSTAVTGTLHGRVARGDAPMVVPEVGQYAELSRTFDRAMVDAFAAVSGDFNPIHMGPAGVGGGGGGGGGSGGGGGGGGSMGADGSGGGGGDSGGAGGGEGGGGGERVGEVHAQGKATQALPLGLSEPCVHGILASSLFSAIFG